MRTQIRPEADTQSRGLVVVGAQLRSMSKRCDGNVADAAKN